MRALVSNDEWHGDVLHVYFPPHLAVLDTERNIRQLSCPAYIFLAYSPIDHFQKSRRPTR